eukprot:3941241-Prymnesium_polylepis.1
MPERRPNGACSTIRSRGLSSAMNIGAFSGGSPRTVPHLAPESPAARRRARKVGSLWPRALEPF